jgi:enoyl-CoA hydratase
MAHDASVGRLRRPLLTVSVLLAERHGSTQILTLHRPERRNALNTELLRALEQGFAEAEASEEVDVIVLTGTDPAFCGGVDLRELEERGHAPEMGDPLRGVSKPVIGAINGPAVTGGLELALMCDLLVASERASFADTHARIGLLPGWGGLSRLSLAVGTRRAAEMVLTSRPVTAEQSLRIGLVNDVVPHDDLLPRALSLADAVLEGHQGAVRAMLAQLRDGAGAPLGELLARERDRAEAWQGAGFDTGLVKRQREERTSRTQGR